MTMSRRTVQVKTEPCRCRRLRLVYSGAGVRFPLSPLLCIASDLRIQSEQTQVSISRILISPSGFVVFILHEENGSPVQALDIVKKLDSDALDRMAEECSYRDSGQAFRIIDLMAAHGCATFSGAGRLYKGIDGCMGRREFLIYYAPIEGL